MSAELPAPHTRILSSVLKTFYEDDFTSLTKLDSGGEGVAYMGFCATFGNVCAKVYNKAHVLPENAKEVDVLMKNHYHPNVVRLFGFFEQKHPRFTAREQIGYVMELMDGGSLHSVIYSTEKYGPEKVFNWIAQAGRGLQYLHEAKIIHRDIKPNNMLLNRTHDQLKLSDFGLAKKFDGTNFTVQGTYIYMAPELINCNGERYTCAVDVYALAISIWEMFYRRTPFKNLTLIYLGQEVMKGTRPELNDNLDRDVRRLIESSWSGDPSLRCKVMEIVNFADKRKARPLPHVLSRKTPAPLPTPIDTTRMAISAPAQRSPGPQSPISPSFTTSKRIESKTEYAFRCLAQIYFYVHSPESFKTVVFEIKRFLHELERELIVPGKKASLTKFFVLGPKGVVPNGGDYYARTGTPILLGEDLVFGSDNKRFSLGIYYNLSYCNDGTLQKVRAYQNVINRIEMTYGKEGERVYRQLQDKTQKFTCLFVGIGQIRSRDFLRALARETFTKEGLTNPMKLYPMSHYAMDIPKERQLASSTDLIWNEVNKLGRVHRICFLVDSAQDNGIFGAQWTSLANYSNATFCLGCGSDEPSDRKRFLEKFSPDFQLDLLTFTRGDFHGINFTNLNKVYEPFFLTYMRCVENLVRRKEPLLPLTSLDTEPRFLVTERIRTPL